jgi:hypothetical protein
MFPGTVMKTVSRWALKKVGQKWLGVLVTFNHCEKNPRENQERFWLMVSMHN